MAISHYFLDTQYEDLLSNWHLCYVHGCESSLIGVNRMAQIWTCRFVVGNAKFRQKQKVNNVKEAKKNLWIRNTSFFAFKYANKFKQFLNSYFAP